MVLLAALDDSCEKSGSKPCDLAELIVLRSLLERRETGLGLTWKPKEKGILEQIPQRCTTFEGPKAPIGGIKEAERPLSELSNEFQAERLEMEPCLYGSEKSKIRR